MPRRRRASRSIWTPRTIRSTATRKAASSTASTTATATCRSTCSAASIYWRPSCAASNIDASAGATEEIARIVTRIRARWPRVRILLRADSGFAREALMAWCEANKVDYLFGLARNSRLVEQIHIELAWAEDEAERTGQNRPAGSPTSAGPPATAGASAGGSWGAKARVDAGPRRGRRQHRGSSSPRSPRRRSTPRRSTSACTVHAATWRTGSRSASSTCSPTAPGAATMKANQLRLWFASMAYVLLAALRRIALAHTQLEKGNLRIAAPEVAEDRCAGDGPPSAASASPWPRPVPTQRRSPSRTPDCAADPAPAALLHPPVNNAGPAPTRNAPIRRNGHACPRPPAISPPPVSNAFTHRKPHAREICGLGRCRRFAQGRRAGPLRGVGRVSAGAGEIRAVLRRRRSLRSRPVVPERWGCRRSRGDAG